METFGLYIFKSAIWLTGFTLVFLTVLRNEKYFRLNRMFLLSGIIASVVFPLYTWHYAVILPSLPEVNVSVQDLKMDAVTPATTAIPIYWWFYLVGVAYLFFRTFRQTALIVRKLQKIGFVKSGPVKLVRTSEYVACFHFSHSRIFYQDF